MECNKFFNSLKTRIKLIDSLWISIKFLIIFGPVSLEPVWPGGGPTRKKIAKNWAVAELLNKDYIANAFVCEKLKALYLL
jgi:hypothetical protein